MAELVLITENKKCHFCKLCQNDQMKYGPLYKLGSVTAHYYCVLLSSNLCQRGEDDEGILGFLFSDVQAELKRTQNVKCYYCKKENATIACQNSKCRKVFHLPCGLEAGSLNQFVNTFHSYCSTHRPRQNIPKDVLKNAKASELTCYICYEKLEDIESNDTLWAPCCAKSWFHRLCVQKLAHNAGYFFKCPLCNDVDKFNRWMLKYGIFIPQRDASWELEPNAFADLLYRYDKCDAPECRCPDGRQHNREDTRWKIVLCEFCGSQGIHIACGRLKFIDPQWQCSCCKEITNIPSKEKPKSEATTQGGASDCLPIHKTGKKKKRKRVSEDNENTVLDKRKKGVSSVETSDMNVTKKRINYRDYRYEDVSDSDAMIDIESVHCIGENSDMHEAMTKLKPGPLSYKLAVISAMSERRFIESRNKRNYARSIIKISDSDSDSESESESESDSESDSEPEMNDLLENSEDDVEVISVVDEENRKNCSDLRLHFRVKKNSHAVNEDKGDDDTEEDADENSEDDADEEMEDDTEGTDEDSEGDTDEKMSLDAGKNNEDETLEDAKDKIPDSTTDSDQPTGMPGEAEQPQTVSIQLLVPFSVRNLEDVEALNAISPNLYALRSFRTMRRVKQVPSAHSGLLNTHLISTNYRSLSTPVVRNSNTTNGLTSKPSKPVAMVKPVLAVQRLKSREGGRR